MAELKKIYRGMQNGAETINDNFEILTRDTGWQDIETMNGFKSGGFPLQYRVFQGAVHLRGRINTVTTSAGTDVQFGKIPVNIAQQHEWLGTVIGGSNLVRLMLFTSGVLKLSPIADVGNNFQISGFDTNCLID
ncbi:hypothetical protein [Lactococcus petauri]|uniref:hypothetical protein n=1 Tax=Lactococcus petauri TaxID=1940789 RepID=UPI0013FD2DBE|nr:hypothetical protein [Lactococcus petauri]